MDIGKIQTLRCLDLDEFSDDATDISCLSHLVNLHTLVISSMCRGPLVEGTNKYSPVVKYQELVT